MTAPDLAPGTVVGGRYTVATRIGGGARSTTYRASNGDASEVALKVYDPALPPGMLDSLRRAGEGAAAVTAAALAPLDAGVDPATGAPFAVQELSARPSLAQLVELCPLAPADAVALVRSLARALAPLHERGVAHGALAPTNVFVGPPPACEVRLSDFGAPGDEQAPADAVATDLEGAARLVSFALTGRPFGSPGPQVDPAWGAVFRHAMHPREGEAYASLDALADALERAAQGHAPQGRATQGHAPSPTAEPAPPEARRTVPVSRPWMIGLGAVACLVIAMGIAVAVKLARPSAQPSPSASVAAAAPTPEAPSVAPETASAPTPPPASGEAPAASESAAANDVPPAEEPKLPPGDHWHGLLVVRCIPSCDSVFVDGHAVAHADRGTLLPPGVHTVGANLANHPSKVKPVLVRRGRVRKLDLSF